MNQPLVNIIAAVDENWGIGLNNKLLCHLPRDLKHFKQITMGHSIIMGNKTFRSIGQALPGRRNIVLSSNTGSLSSSTLANIEVANSINEVFKLTSLEKEIFIIGGASVYQQFMPFCRKIFLTIIHNIFPADTYFPNITLDDWILSDKQDLPQDHLHQFSYSFLTLIRK